MSPSLEAEGSGLVTTTFDDATVVLDVDGGRIGRGDPLAGHAWTWTTIGDAAGAVTALSAIGDDVITLGDDGTVARLAEGADALAVETIGSTPVAVTTLAQPAPAGSPLVVVTADGTVFGDDIVSAEKMARVATASRRTCVRSPNSVVRIRSPRSSIRGASSTSPPPRRRSSGCATAWSTRPNR